MPVVHLLFPLEGSVIPSNLMIDLAFSVTYGRGPDLLYLSLVGAANFAYKGAKCFICSSKSIAKQSFTM